MPPSVFGPYGSFHNPDDYADFREDGAFESADLAMTEVLADPTSGAAIELSATIDAAVVAAGGGGVTIDDTAPASGFWLDTGVSIPNINPTIDLSVSADELDAVATWTAGDVDGHTPLAYSIDWGDGTATSGVASGVAHTYTADGTYSVTVTVTDSLGATGTDTASVSVGAIILASYFDQVLADDPAVYVRLNETSGTVANDSGPNNRDGTYVNGVTLNQGTLLGDGTGSSVLFDGTNDHVSFASGTWNQLASMTVECRIKTTATLSGVFLGGRWGGAGAQSWLLQIEGGYLRAQAAGPGVRTAVIGQMVANTEYTIAMTIAAGGNLHCFVNGVKVIDANGIGGWDAGVVVAPLLLGGITVGAYGNVRMSEFSMYDHILSDARMAERHAAAIEA